MNGVEVTPARARRTPHWFVFPWSGAVDLHTIAAVQGDDGQVVLQLHGGGFLRGPKRSDASEIAAQIVTALVRLPDVHVTEYDTRLGQAQRQRAG